MTTLRKLPIMVPKIKELDASKISIYLRVAYKNSPSWAAFVLRALIS
jgi:hypothetical protein